MPKYQGYISKRIFSFPLRNVPKKGYQNLHHEFERKNIILKLRIQTSTISDPLREIQSIKNLIPPRNNLRIPLCVSHCSVTYCSIFIQTLRKKRICFRGSISSRLSPFQTALSFRRMHHRLPWSHFIIIFLLDKFRVGVILYSSISFCRQTVDTISSASK